MTMAITYILENIFMGGSGVVNERDDVEETTKLLVTVVVNHFSGYLLGNVHQPSCTTTLLKVIDHISEQHNELYSRYTFHVCAVHMLIGKTVL